MPALVEMLATLAGVARPMISLQQAAAVYWAIIRPLLRPGVGDRYGLRWASGSRAASIQKVRRSEMPATWARAIVRASSGMARGMPWKLPAETMGSPPEEKTRGLSVTAASSRSTDCFT
jgi:hypothetical protein